MKVMLIRLLPALLALVTVTGLGPLSESRAAEHPRIFLRTEELTSGRNLRGRVAITGSHCEEYALLTQWAERHLGAPVANSLSDPGLTQEAALTCALLYQLSGDARYGRRAVDLVRALITSHQGRLPGFDWPRLPVTVATVFDWTYASLSPEDRQRLLYDILKRCIYVRDREAPDDPAPFDSTPYLKPLLFAALALEDEPEASRYAAAWKRYCRSLLFQRVLPDLNAAGGVGAWLPRAGGLDRELDVLECLEAWRSATRRTAGQSTSEGAEDRLPPHFRHLGRRILYRLRPGLVLAGLGGDPPRTGVTPALLYLLSHHEDRKRGRESFPALSTTRVEKRFPSPFSPTGRWLAEGLRVARPLEPGSAAWLRDLRARILWLAKGERRVPPREEELPLATTFEDAGEVVARSNWDLMEGDALWCLFRVSSAGPLQYPYWNHLSVVRGNDALAVEANVAGAPESAFAERWFGTPWAQNTVIVPGWGPETALDFVLEAHSSGVGFSYARGRVAKATGGTNGYSFVRQLVTFPEGLIVVHDRVSGSGQPIWLLHMLDEPRLLGRVAKVAGLRAGGISESTDARGATWQTGRSRGYLLFLLPRHRRMRTIGVKDYEFWVQATGKNPWPTKRFRDGQPVPSFDLAQDGESVEPYSREELRRLEVGTWRLEVSAAESAAGRTTEFVTVLAAGPTYGAEPQASLREDAGALIITVLWSIGPAGEEQKYQVVFQPDGAASIVVEDARSGKTVRQGIAGSEATGEVGESKRSETYPTVPAQSNAPSSRD